MAKEAKVLLKTVCEEGEAHERIVDLADAENCDLIVMGRRGLRRIERVFVGSVTARVIGYSHIDVLVMPRDTTVGWKKALVATDGSRFSKAASEKAIDFAKSYGGELKVVSVVDVPAEFYGESPKTVEGLINKAKGFVEDVKRQAEAAGVRAETFVRGGEAYQKIVELAKELNVDTIVMGSHGRTGIKRLLMGSVAEKVIGYAPCPVLVVKA
jgi:nucleotide-binding universal stress UspA family protein